METPSTSPSTPSPPSLSPSASSVLTHLNDDGDVDVDYDDWKPHKNRKMPSRRQIIHSDEEEDDEEQTSPPPPPRKKQRLNEDHSKTKKIAIIGSAGRGAESVKMTKPLFDKMLAKVERIITDRLKLEWRHVTLVSGGAAWSDHVAVKLYLRHGCDLTLHLPCEWDHEKQRFIDIGVSDWRSNPGRSANRYHEEFAKVTGYEPFKDISEAICMGANVSCHYGFGARNTAIAQGCDVMIAFSWSIGNVPDQGGTKDTWEKCTAGEKIHISLDNLNRSRQLLVLDLNGVLLDKKRSISRPHLEEFLEFVFEHFDVMVWSSAQPHTVERMLDNFFRSYKPRLIATWTRDMFGLTPEQYNSKCATIKDLRKVWDEFGERYGVHNTILVDNFIGNAREQPNNLVHVSTFNPDQNASDNELVRLIKYLELLKQQDDVTMYIKRIPYV